MSMLIRLQYSRRATLVSLAATGGVLASYSVLMLLYVRPVGAPIEMARILFSLFLLTVVIGTPLLTIFWLRDGRPKRRAALVGLSLFCLGITFATLALSYWGNQYSSSLGDVRIRLSDGLLRFHAYGPPPTLPPVSLSGPDKFFCMPANPVTWSVELPLSIPAAFFVIVPTVELRHWVRRWRRRRSGVCEDCGYDLRGAMRTCSECGTHVGRCPECGTVVVQAGQFHAAAPC